MFNSFSFSLARSKNLSIFSFAFGFLVFLFVCLFVCLFCVGFVCFFVFVFLLCFLFFCFVLFLFCFLFCFLFFCCFYSFIVWFCFIFTLWSAGKANPQYDRFFFLNNCNWPRLGDPFVSQNPREFYVSNSLVQILVCPNNIWQYGQILIFCTIPSFSVSSFLVIAVTGCCSQSFF